MLCKGDVLGLFHELARAFSDDEIVYTPRERIAEKISRMLDAMLTPVAGPRLATPGAIAKRRGTAQFASVGMYSKLGRGASEH